MLRLLTSGYRSCVLLALATLVAQACDEATEPSPGYVKAFVRVTGRDPDNGFVVHSDTVKRDVVANNFTVFAAPPGSIQMQLEDVADNCLVNGGNPRTVEVSRRDTTLVNFAVECAATGVNVETHTTGLDFPATYRVALPTLGEIPMLANGFAEVTNLKPGKYQVKLTLTASNCAASSGTELTADVVNRQITNVRFDIQCKGLPRTGSIAYVQAGTLFLMNADGSEQQELNKGWGPSWSRDGKKLVYSATECDYYNYVCTGSLAIVDPLTRQITQLSQTLHGVSPAWSPVDDVIAYTDAEGSQGIWLYDVATMRTNFISSVTPMYFYDPSWSPDGKKLVATCFVPSGARLCILNRDGSDLRMIGGFDLYDPAWSPDGTAIVMMASVPDGPKIATINPDGTGFRTLTVGYSPAWSPDGTFIIFAAPNSGLFTITRDGSSLRRLTTGSQYSPAWRP